MRKNCKKWRVACRMYVEKYLPLEDISRKLGIHLRTLELWCDRYNWHAQRVAHGITPHELNRQHLRAAAKLLEQINADGAEAGQKEIKAIEQAQRSLKAGNPNAPTINLILAAFFKWAKKNRPRLAMQLKTITQEYMRLNMRRKPRTVPNGWRMKINGIK